MPEPPNYRTHFSDALCSLPVAHTATLVSCWGERRVCGYVGKLLNEKENFNKNFKNMMGRCAQEIHNSGWKCITGYVDKCAHSQSQGWREF